ncbi:MAG: ATPase, T2SS/T4P/T4SS family [bacterium]
MAKETTKNSPPSGGGEAFGGHKIAEVLVRRRVLTEEGMRSALERMPSNAGRLERYLVESHAVPVAEMTLAVADYLRMPPISLANYTPNADLIASLPAEIIKHHLILPMIKFGGVLTVAMGDPFDIVALDELQHATGLQITPLVASEKEVQDVLSHLMANSAASNVTMEDILQSSDDNDVEVGSSIHQEESLEEMLESAEGAPVIRMVNMIMVEALRTRASDIHIEPLEKTLRLRYRVDGDLVERPNPPKSFQAAIVSRIKIMSELDIAERRLPQDGRCRIRALGKEVDIRVSILPTIHGEKVVMRVLDKGSLCPNVAALGLDKVAYEALRYAIAQPHGIILVTGPTGSGKTTTLYSCLQELNQPDVNIVTCEDPVEYQLPGVNQVQVNPLSGLTFEGALRSILRQDPDIVLVGEIRDGATADIAVKAALTGHLVLSTLHTNDAAGAIARLIDMGVPPFLMASSLILAQAQRLYRKLCPFCRQEARPAPEILIANHIDPAFFKGATLYEAVGCTKCGNTGFKGRGAIMEVLPVDEDIRECILRGVSTADLRAKARQKGMLTLKEVGLQKVRDGITSLKSALEMTGGD